MGKIHIEASANPIAAEMARLNKIAKLIPDQADVVKFGLEVEEMEMVLEILGLQNSEYDFPPLVQLIVTVLRKRQEQKTKKSLHIQDLSEFVSLMTETHINEVNGLLAQMKNRDVIKIGRRNRVRIKI